MYKRQVVVNAKLRKAIGHNDVEYDAVSQVITYIPNPKDRTIKKTEYLLEFENEAMHMFQEMCIRDRSMIVSFPMVIL